MRIPYRYLLLVPILFLLISCNLWTKIIVPQSVSPEKTAPQKPHTPTLALADKLTPQIKIDSLSEHLSNISDFYEFSKEMEQIDMDSLYMLFETVPDTDRPTFSPDEVARQIEAMQQDVKIYYNKDIQKFIDRFTSKHGRKYLSKVLAISELYFPIIEQIFQEEGIPQEMKYAAIVESGLTPNIMSHAGAVGFWQFMYYTGKRNGLEINSTVDDRCSIIASTRAAAKYMKSLYEMYGDWLLVLAAYNSGPGNVNKAIRKNNGNHNFLTIQKNLPKETRRHIPKFIAIYYAFHYHTNLMIAPQRNLVKFTTIDTVQVNKPVHLGQIASLLDMQEKDLALLNRNYLKGYIPGKENKEYILLLPNEKRYDYTEKRNKIYDHNRNLYYTSTGKHIAKKQRFYPVYGIPGNGKRIKYRVRSGDCLGCIANRFGISVKKIKAWNGLRSNNIRIGQTLYLYGVNRYTPKYSSTRKQKANVKLPYTPDKYVYHTVKKNENCWTIAQKYKGVSQSQILKLNKISNPQQLHIGQKIRIKLKN